ncbi:MAG: hypothetical protein CM1200mP12_05400 [Gammaproteobacteria bacterium]|nr:MAG: hypothetical protein CM1200mP12_05400 [Gammaproteobacteria bacterium]
MERVSIKILRKNPFFNRGLRSRDCDCSYKKKKYRSRFFRTKILIFFYQINSQFCQILQVLYSPKRQSEHVNWQENYWGGNNLVKLEVLGDKETLYPNMPETLKAGPKILLKMDFKLWFIVRRPLTSKKIRRIRLCFSYAPCFAYGLGLGFKIPKYRNDSFKSRGSNNC